MRLLNFVLASATLARLRRDPDVLDIPLGMCEAIQGDLQPKGHGAPARAWLCRCAGLPVRTFRRSGYGSSRHGCVPAWDVGLRVDGFRRLEAARAGARFAASCNETGPSLELYGLAIDLLGTVIWRGIDRRDQERLLTRYAELRQMPPRSRSPQASRNSGWSSLNAGAASYLADSSTTVPTSSR